MRLVELNCDLKTFETIRDALIHDPRTKFGLFNESYSKKLSLGRFWGSEYVPETVAGNKFREFQLIPPNLKEIIFDVASVEQQLH